MPKELKKNRRESFTFKVSKSILESKNERFIGN
jgi:hypothetical protein